VLALLASSELYWSWGSRALACLAGQHNAAACRTALTCTLPGALGACKLGLCLQSECFRQTSPTGG
jgi:hypothetical protein